MHAEYRGRQRATMPVKIRFEHVNGGEFAGMSQSLTTPPMPVDYYLRHAVRVRELARKATTQTIKLHLHETALEYERLAENAHTAVRRSTVLG
jgi:hypothetical protein